MFVGNNRLIRTETVEKFRYDEKRRKLYHLRTYRDPTITQSVLLSKSIYLVNINQRLASYPELIHFQQVSLAATCYKRSAIDLKVMS